MNFYNEINLAKAAWLRELISDGLITPGIVDERSIKDVNASELAYSQCHFFAGIGGWSYALRLAGWPDSKPVWTGSCPCQPFSQAGKRKVDKDERHLWPAFRDAIAIGRPATVFGEQVASKDGRIWLARVRADLEALGYVVGAADLCAAGVSAPHIRQRLYWVAHTNHKGPQGRHGAELHERADQLAPWSARSCSAQGLGQSNGSGSQPGTQAATTAGHRHSSESTSRPNPVWLEDANRAGWTERHAEKRSPAPAIQSGQSGQDAGLVNANGYHQHWWSGPLQVGRNSIEAEITRGGRKYRAQWRLEPGLPLLAARVPGRVDQISGFGDAIVPQLAAEFIQAFVETQNPSPTS